MASQKSIQPATSGRGQTGRSSEYIRRRNQFLVSTVDILGRLGNAFNIKTCSNTTQT